jgi:putative hemolysin
MQVASEAAAEGAVEPEEVDMIESVMAFGERTAAEIMTPRTDVVALPAEATAEEVRNNVVTHGHTRIPIYDGDIDNIIGILHAKDLLAGDNLQHLELRKIIRKPFFVPESKKLDGLLKEFKARQMHMAVVLDEYGGTAGLVTIEDLLEEIVGNIGDEYDSGESPLMKRLDERTVEVDGRMRIGEFNDALRLHLPETEDYDTVAGLVFSELGFIPAAGEVLTTQGVTFTVLAADARKISRLKVELPKEGQGEEIDH